MGQKSTRHATQILTRELNGGEQEPLYIAFHDKDPGAEGDQATNELSYAGYGRAAIPRSGQSWTIKDGKAVNAMTVAWPPCQGGTGTARFFSIGTAAFGPGEMIRRGKLTKPKDGLIINPGIEVKAKPGTLTLIES